MQEHINIWVQRCDISCVLAMAYGNTVVLHLAIDIIPPNNSEHKKLI